MVDPRPTARRRMEARFGVPGSGSRTLTIGTAARPLAEVMARLGIWFEGCRPIDGFELGPMRYVVRYYDPEDQRIVAYEFDAEYRYVAEMRVDVAEWKPESLTEGVTPWT